MDEHFRVTIFGSARIKKDDPVYKEVYKLSRLIAKEDVDIVTGGGPGLMDAANKGHKEGRKTNKVHSIGLNIMLPKEQQANVNLDIKKDFERFSDRLDTFMALSNVIVVTPGGIGTILELFYSWQLIQVKHICKIPIILYGSMWEPLIDWMKNYPLRRKLISKEDFDSIFIAKNCSEAMRIIRQAKQDFTNGGEKSCINLKKYKLKDSKLFSK